MQSASNPHAFMGVTEQGLAAIVKTRGNKDVHVILRGGTKGPNYASEHVRSAASVIEKKRKAAGDPEPIASIMIDCSRACPFFLVFLTRMVLLTPFLAFFGFPSLSRLLVCASPHAPLRLCTVSHSYCRWQLEQEPQQPAPRCQGHRSSTRRG